VTSDVIYLHTLFPKLSQFKTIQISMRSQEELKFSPITAATSFRTNLNDPNLKNYAKHAEKVFIVVSGHKNGKVVYWENTEYKGYLDNYKEEIVSIVSYSKGIVIATGRSYLHFWDLNL